MDNILCLFCGKLSYIAKECLLKTFSPAAKAHAISAMEKSPNSSSSAKESNK